MRTRIFRILACAGGLLAAACAGGGAGSGAASGSMGDLAAGGDPAEGGISEVPNPTAAMAARSGKSLGRIQRGHEVYMLKCGECHTYMLPHAVDIEDWEDAMPTMIRHAGLPSSDEQAVLDYVIAVKSQ
jgi:cytochrome c5